MPEGNADDDDATNGESDASAPADPTADPEASEPADTAADTPPSEPSESVADGQTAESPDPAADTAVSESSDSTPEAQSPDSTSEAQSPDSTPEAQSSEATADAPASVSSDETVEEPPQEPSEATADTQMPESSDPPSDTTASESPEPASDVSTPDAPAPGSDTSASESSDPAPETQASGSANPAPDAPTVGSPEPAGGGPAPGSPEPVGGGGDFAGAPDDQEMPLTEHIREMVRRLAVVIAVMAVVSVVVFPFADRLINWLWYSFLPGPPSECVQAIGAAGGPTVGSGTDAACPRLYHPLSLVLARLKVASLAGFIVALPVFVYETYLFMRPGLYPNERRYYLASVPTSLVLAAVGLAFAYFLVLPVIFIYFLGYSQPVAEIAFSLSQTFDLILLMLGMFAFIFQIPLFMMLAIMMGVTSRRWLETRRLYFWMGFAGVAFIFSPDPTGMAPFIVAATMVLLFEGTLVLLRWTGR